MNRRDNARRIVPSALAFLCLFASGTAQAAGREMRQEMERGPQQRESVVLPAPPGTVRWATVYKILPERPDDPYFHVQVFERRNGSKPWVYKELVFHMAVTPKALEASRTGKTAKIGNYKDVEIRSDYRRWLDDPAARARVPVCDTDILSCVKALPRQP